MPGLPRDRLPLTLGVLAAVLLGALVVGGPWAEGVFVAGSLAVPVLLMALGAGRRRPRWLGWVLAGLGGLLVACGLAILGLSGRSEPRLLGMPPAMAVEVLGLFALPFLISVTAYARSFDAASVGPTALARLRALAAQEAVAPPAEPPP